MKSVLISIQPKWCEFIASGKKTVEVRKTKPKIDVPFKCYIYCTKNTKKNALHTYIRSGYGRKTFGIIEQWRSGKEVVDVNAHLPAYRYNAYLAEGKVIGEFTCYGIFPVRVFENGGIQDYMCHGMERSLVPYDDIATYIGKNKTGYGWHISDLVIYDKPKELCEFAKPDKCPYNSPIGCTYGGHCYRAGQAKRCGGYVERPPQSWCYVEEGD